MKKHALFSLMLILALFLQSCQGAQLSTKPEPETGAATAIAPSVPINTPTETIPVFTKTPIVHPLVNWQYRGATLAGYWHDSYSLPNAFDTVDYLAGLGVNDVTLIVSWYQDNMKAIDIVPRFEKETATDKSLQNIIQYIHSKNMGVMLKPHLEPDKDWQDETKNNWRGVINPSDHARWFESYDKFILHYAQLAQQENVELFSLGTEMASMTQSQEDQGRWVDLAQRVRQIYHQKILYSAHEYEVMGGNYGIPGTDINFSFTPLPASFWSNFDYAGATFYYDIQNIDKEDTPAPTVSELMADWIDNPNRHANIKNLLTAFQTWQNTIKKQVIFSEIGYRSIDYAAVHPYTTAGSNLPEIKNSANYNELAQANAYSAALATLGNTNWLVGAFWWQFIPNPVNQRECGQNVDPSNEINYTPCGKQAAGVLKEWYGGNQTTVPPSYGPQFPDLLNLDQLNEVSLHRRWQAQSSGELTYNLDSSVHLEGQSRSLLITSNVACDSSGRFAQLDYTFSQPQNFSTYRSMVISARTAAPEKRGELSIALLGTDGVEWLSSRTLSGDQWQQFTIGLSAASDRMADPWANPGSFSVATWFKPDSQHPVTEPYHLDLARIAGIRIKTLTADSDCATTPQFEAWIGQVHLSQENPPTPTPSPTSVPLPLLDSFNYNSQDKLDQAWQVSKSSNARVTLSTGQGDGNKRAMLISTDLPCADGRYAIVMHRYNPPIDLRSFKILKFEFKGDQLKDPPYGGELSVLLLDASSTPEEVWQSTRWFDRTWFWNAIQISLIGAASQGDPFKHPMNFVIPAWEKIVDGKLDLSHIAGVGFKLNTTCDQYNYSSMSGWIENLVVR